MKFSCLPAALEMDILMAFRVKRESESPSSTVEFNLKNTNPRFEGTSFQSKVDSHQGVELDHTGSSRWANYFKVAFKGLLPHLPSSVLESSSRPCQVDVMIDGTIPPESSLSSSAAMTSCSSIVVLQAFQAREIISRKEMAEVAIESERLVGVNSGGMDQAASIFGVVGSALHVSFVPELSAVPIKLPPSEPPHMFVIANTLVTSDKKVMGPFQYNLRVGELRMACRALAKELQLPQDDSTKVLKDLMEVYFSKHPLQEGKEDEDVTKVWKSWGLEAAKMCKLKDIALRSLPEQPIDRAKVEQLTGYKGSDYDKEFLSEFPSKCYLC
jgi:galactokinase